MQIPKLSKSKVLITGAGGFIGSHLCELVLSQGASVRAFVHYNSRNDWGMLEDLDKRQLREIEVVAGDLRDAYAVRRAVRGSSVVFHLGALIGIPYSYANPADVVATNVMGTLHVLQTGLEAGITRLVQTSTSEVERLFASNRKAGELLSWRPEVSLAQGLEKTVRWFRARTARHKRDLYHI